MVCNDIYSFNTIFLILLHVHCVATSFDILFADVIESASQRSALNDSRDSGLKGTTLSSPGADAPVITKATDGALPKGSFLKSFFCSHSFVLVNSLDLYTRSCFI